jgi:hypothetical protein
MVNGVQPFLIELDRWWIEVRDGNHTCRTIFRRHYTYRPYRDGRDPALFVGPEEKLVLLTASAKALFVWRKLWRKLLIFERVTEVIA